jgi:L-ascorbate metabolism protein UlaG (beta-lactamase superfamily)
MHYKNLSFVSLLLALSCSLQAEIKVTQLANEGVIVEGGDVRIMLDGMVVESYSVYGGLPPAAAEQFDQAAGAFAGIDLALVSHRHHDHNQPAHACRFLQASVQTEFKSSAQVLGLMREKCRTFVTTSPRVVEINPAYDQQVQLQQGDAKITVFSLSHGTRKYARIQNFGHLIELAGMTLLHIGDAAMHPADFERAGLRGRKIDVALIPFWFFQPGPGESVIREFMDAPHKIAVHIPPAEMAEVQGYMRENFPKVMILANPLDSADFTATR